MGSGGNFGGNIFDIRDEIYRYAWVGKFFAHVFSPKTIGQQVVFYSGVSLDVIISAVVVGQQESFGRNHLAGAAAIELRYGIFYAGFAGVKNLFCGNLHSQFFHFYFVKFCGHPHAAVLL